MVIIAPIWSEKTWFPLLLRNLSEHPIRLTSTPDLLVNPLGDPHPLILQNRLPLAAWKVSGIPACTALFQKKLSNCYVQPGEKELRSHIPEHGGNGLSGAQIIN